MKSAYFTSTGRTGTDFFTTLFNDVVANSWSLHEPRPAFRRRGKRLLSHNPRLTDVLYFKIPRLLRHMSVSEQWYVETNYHLFACIPVIRKAFPNALVFHVVRDGRDVVTSWLNRYRYIIGDHIVPEDAGDTWAAERWPQWNPLQRLTWYWKTVNERALETPPDMWLKFEEIFSGEVGPILKVLEKFDTIEYTEEAVAQSLKKKINPTKKSFFPKYPEWPQQWQDQFWEIAEPTMNHFGYTN